MARIGVVGTRGGWSSEELVRAVEAATGTGTLIDMRQVRLDLSTGELHANGVDLRSFDALIIKKLGRFYSPNLLDRLEILCWLQEQGVRIFSRPDRIMRLLDRLSCTLRLQMAGIPLPPTTITENIDRAIEAVERYGKAVFKPLYTSKARGMCLIEHGPQAREQIEEYQRLNPVMYIQKRIDLPGRDLGIVFLGGQYLTTYGRRQEKGSWTTTTHFGGRYEPFDPSPELITLAQRAQAPFDLDFTCVDVAESTDGPVVFEVSPFGGFRGLLEARRIDAAQRYVEYVQARLRPV